MVEESAPDTPNPAPPQAPRRKRWVSVVLAISLALNLLIVGVIVGSILSENKAPRGQVEEARRVGYGFGPYVAALSNRDKFAARRSLRARAEDLAQNRRAEREQVEKFIAVLRADPFVPDDLAELFQAQRVRAVERVAVGQEILLGRIGRMSTTQRQRYADRLEHEARRGARK